MVNLILVSIRFHALVKGCLVFLGAFCDLVLLLILLGPNLVSCVNNVAAEWLCQLQVGFSNNLDQVFLTELKTTTNLRNKTCFYHFILSNPWRNLIVRLDAAHLSLLLVASHRDVQYGFEMTEHEPHDHRHRNRCHKNRLDGHEQRHP